MRGWCRRRVRLWLRRGSNDVLRQVEDIRHDEARVTFIRAMVPTTVRTGQILALWSMTCPVVTRDAKTVETVLRRVTVGNPLEQSAKARKRIPIKKCLCAARSAHEERIRSCARPTVQRAQSSKPAEYIAGRIIR